MTCVHTNTSKAYDGITGRSLETIVDFAVTPSEVEPENLMWLVNVCPPAKSAGTELLSIHHDLLDYNTTDANCDYILLSASR